MKSRELLPLDCRGLYEVCESSQDVEDYAERLEEALEAAEEELISKRGVESMSREEFKELMTNVRTAARLIEHDNLKGDEWLDKLFDTLKQVYYLNDLNRTNNVGTESGN